MADALRPINFGKHTYRIAFAKWDGANNVGLIQVYDTDGNPFIVETWGMSPAEQRDAVARWAMHRSVALGSSAPVAEEFSSRSIPNA
jgi:hypothetical protein